MCCISICVPLEDWTLTFVQEEMPKLQDSNTVDCGVHLISYKNLSVR